MNYSIEQLVNYRRGGDEWGKPLLISGTLDRLVGYTSKALAYDMYIKKTWGMFCYRTHFKNVADCWELDFNMMFGAFMVANEWEFNGLKDLMDMEFNPIENYNMVETEKTNRKPDLKSTNSGDTTIGKTIEKSVTNSTPEEKKTTHIDSVIPYDSNVWTDNNKFTEQNETLTEPSSDTTVTGEEHVNKTSYTVTETGTEDIERKLTRSGNIGVTTTQQMAMSQRDYLQFSLFVAILEKFMREYTFLKEEKICEDRYM